MTETERYQQDRAAWAKNKKKLEADADEARRENARLRGLIKAVEWRRQEDPHWTYCPWGCIAETNWDADEDENGQPTGAHGYRHAADCPAFTSSGEVR